MNIPPNLDFSKYIDDLSILESQVMHWGSHWTDELVDIAKNGRRVWGDKLPWSKTHELFRMRPGELTIWAGYNGHRKSLLVGQVMLWAARNAPTCIASFEMRPGETLFRMCQQAATCFPAPEFAQEFGDWSYERLCIYDQLDVVEPLRVLGLIHYAAKELGCKHVVIDSLMKCGVDEKTEKQFIDKLQWAAKRLQVHVHLICHMRKGENEFKVPNKMDVRGTGGITDLADNVVIVWKDKTVARAKEKMLAHKPLSQEEEKALEKPDQLILVEKQRHGAYEGAFSLWFHDFGLQFIPNPDKGPLPFSLNKNLEVA